MAKTEHETLNLGGHEVKISNPSKLYFADAKISKLELVRYYLSVAPGALRGVTRRPMVLKRYVNGAAGEPFFQKRAPDKLPPFIETATFEYPSGGVAHEVVVNNEAALAWVVNLGCIELHPHAVRVAHPRPPASGDAAASQRATDPELAGRRLVSEQPDELRIDLDPVPGIVWPQILEVARVARDVLGELGLTGWPKTSGSRGAHIWVRIEPRWPFAQVRRAAQAFAREVALRAPGLATAEWAKEQRRGVFIDYNQNARDRTTCSAYSVRATPDARVSMPLSWDAFLACDPRELTLRTVPAMLQANGDAHEHIDEKPCTLDALLALADRQKALPSKAKPVMPVITIAQAKQKPEALAGLERWKARHPDVASKLAPEDVIVDTNRGRATAWYRVRINLKNVPVELHPPPAPPDPDYDFKVEWEGMF